MNVTLPLNSVLAVGKHRQTYVMSPWEAEMGYAQADVVVEKIVDLSVLPLFLINKTVCLVDEV